MDANARRANPVFCTIVPPHVLDKLARAADPAIAESAARTLEHDALQRTRRRITTVRGLAPSVSAIVSDRPNRTIYDAGHHETVPGRKVHSENDEPATDATRSTTSACR